MNHHDHDDHTHTTLTELHDCVARQRHRMHVQMILVVVFCLLAIGFWFTR